MLRDLSAVERRLEIANPQTEFKMSQETAAVEKTCIRRSQIGLCFCATRACGVIESEGQPTLGLR
jgi:hypothetical protein